MCVDRYSSESVEKVCWLGWQNCGTFAVNSFLQLTSDGAVIPQTDYKVWMDQGNFKQIPVPTVSKLNSTAVKSLYQTLKDEFPHNTYMTCVLMGGKSYLAHPAEFVIQSVTLNVNSLGHLMIFEYKINMYTR